jgi:hypothetical protein
MKFESQICTTKEQSERLLALGLKKETADMYYPNGIQDSEHTIRAIYPDFWESGRKIDAFIRGRVMPAWSLHRLIEIIDIWDLDLNFHEFAYEQIISYFEERVKGGFINKEYLEQ